MAFEAFEGESVSRSVKYMPSILTDYVCSLFGHVNEVAARTVGEFNGINSPLLKRQVSN
jgi:hypothetical protein